MRISLIFGLMLFSFAVTADIAAITNAGQSVVLHSDGKWEFSAVDNDTGDFDFRKARWGMTKAQVKQAETGKIQKVDDLLVYKSTIAGLSTYVAYIFVNDQLVRAKYIFEEPHTNKNMHIVDYEKVKSIISKKYQQPIQDKTIWSNSMFKTKPESRGLAVSMGHLAYFASWGSDRTQIWLALDGDNFDVSFVAEYSSVALAGLETAEKEAKDEKQF